MINPTTYHRPKTLDEALHALNRPDSVALIGGGLLLRGVLLPYAAVVDMQDLQEFKGVRYANENITLGGNASLQDVFASDYVLPRMRDCIGRLLPINQRNGISVHESITAPDAPLEWLSSLVALGATLDHTGFEKGKLTANEHTSQPIADFLSELNHFGMPYAGFVKHVHIPIAQSHAALGTAVLARTPRDIPIVQASAFIALDDAEIVTTARIALVGAHRKNRVLQLQTQALQGQRFDLDSIQAFAQKIPDQTLPLGDYRGSEDYRRAMSAVITQRALTDALKQLL
jgi:carbon-monoxide dehydrogenase medium subunit